MRPQSLAASLFCVALFAGAVRPVHPDLAAQAAPQAAQASRGAQGSDSTKYVASGPYVVDLQQVPPGEYDPNNQLATGRGEIRIESQITEEEADRLRAEALNLPPSPGLQRALPAVPGSRAPVSAGVAFDSLDANECCGGGLNVPPDSELAVGLNHIIAVVNVAFEIYDKNGTSLVGPITFSSFFAGTPGCTSTEVFDPNVVYDEAEDRFVLGIDGNGDNYCVAASATGDPTGLWSRYGFATNIGGAFFDFPHAGVGRDAIYLGSNQFQGGFLEGRVFAMDKFAMYAGTPMTVVSRSTGFIGGTPQPMNLHGFLQGTWPTAGPHYIMTEVFDGAHHAVWSWSDPFGTNVLVNEGNLDLNAATGVTAAFPIDAPQAGSGTLIQANDWRGLDTEYRNGELWMTNTLGCNPGTGTVDCIRWARIDPTGPSVIDAGVFGSPNDYRFFPDLAVNQCGDMAVGYTKSSASMFPSVWVTGRESTDPQGMLQAETELKAGERPYDSFQRPGPHRWGDYSGMTIDPDGQRFWYIGEYSKDINNFNTTTWGNYIGSFEYPTCAGSNGRPVVAISSPPDGSTFAEGASIDFSGMASDPEDGDLTAELGWTSSIDGAIGSGGSFSTVLSVGTHTVTASVTDGEGLAGSTSITVIVEGNAPPSVTITSPADGSTFAEGALVDFSGTAFDAEDGGLAAGLAWTSSLDGAIDSGGAFSAVLSVGTHTVTASVTDGGGLPGSDSITVTVNPAGGTTEDTFTSIGADDGLIVESSETSDAGGIVDSTSGNVVALRIGDLNQDQQLKSIVSFDTSSIPDDATIVSATLRLRRGLLRGTNPFTTHGAGLVDIRQGAFGGNAALEPGDFQAPATTVGVATLSNPGANGDWSEGVLNSAGLAAVNPSGLTQFRAYFSLDDDDDGIADFVAFRSGNDGDPSNHPQLVVTYSLGGGGNTAPSVTITSPADGSTFSDGTAIDFSGTADDAEDGDLTAGLEWISDLSGFIGTGGSPSAVLSVGTHTVTASVTDSGGLPGSDSITVVVEGNAAPSVTITSPADGSSFAEGALVAFSGTAFDAEDGDLAAGLAWTSSLDGAIDSGGAFSAVLSVGTHTVTASVTDGGGLPGSDSITVTVNPAGGTTEDTFTSIGADDGLIVESSETSDAGGIVDSTSGNVVALRIGDLNQDQQLKSIVSFDTSSIPDDATIVSATLRLRRGLLRGTPFGTLGAALVDVSDGAFGASPALEPADFQAAPTAIGVATLSTPAADGDWAEGALDTAGLTSLNLAGLTQFRVYFEVDDDDDGSRDFVAFRSGDDSDSTSWPQLIVVYQP